MLAASKIKLWSKRSRKNVLILAIMKIAWWFSLVFSSLCSSSYEVFPFPFFSFFYKLIKTFFSLSDSSFVCLFVEYFFLSSNLSFFFSFTDSEARDMEVKHYTSSSASVFASQKLLILLLNLNFSLFVVYNTRFSFQWKL